MIEGCGSNGCEYMTGGTVAILGPAGDNFAAGMYGGMTFVYDAADDFANRVNSDTVVWQRMAGRLERALDRFRPVVPRGHRRTAAAAAARRAGHRGGRQLRAATA